MENSTAQLKCPFHATNADAMEDVLLEAPTAKGHPLVGLLLRVLEEPAATFVDLANRHGEIARFHVLGRETYLVSDPELVTQVFRNGKSYERSYRLLRALLGNGILTNTPDEWRQSRSLVQPAFRPASVGSLVATAVSVTHDAIASLREHAASGDLVDLAAVMRRLTLAIALRQLFGSQITQAQEDTLCNALELTVNEAWSRRWQLVPLRDRLPTARNRRYATALRDFERIVENLVDERQTGTHERDDLLTLLLAARHPMTGEPWPRARIVDEVKTMLVAAHDSTSNTLAWVMYHLATYDDVRAKLLAELTTVLGGEAPVESQLPQLEWQKAVLFETLRLYPPFWVLGRNAGPETTRLGPYRIGADAHLLLSPYVIHRLPSYWESPSTFLPERWIANPKLLRSPAYLPFATGQHRCVGEQFALTEMQIIVAMFWQAFDVELDPSRSVEPHFATTLGPKSGVWARLREKRVA